MSSEFSIQWQCRECGAGGEWRADELAGRLYRLGILRRDADADAELIRELRTVAADRLTCPGCEARGLTLDDAPIEDWHDGVLCEICRSPIPNERLEALPGARRCAACQSNAEQGRDSGEAEYCPKCGSLMVLRLSRSGGIARYKLVCTAVPLCRTWGVSK